MGNKSTKTTVSPDTILSSQSAVNSNSGNQINNHYIDKNLITICISYGIFHTILFIGDKIFIWYNSKNDISNSITQGINVLVNEYKNNTKYSNQEHEEKIKSLRLDNRLKELAIKQAESKTINQ